MSTPFVGQILLFPTNFAPVGYAFCSGQLLPISQNTALFSLLGTYYGGNGITNFALPNLNGRVPIAVGQGPGLSDYPLGQTGGSETVTLTVNNLPPHTHAIDTASLTAAAKCSSAAADRATPVGSVPAVEGAGGDATYSSASPDANMMAGSVALGGTMTATPTGGGVAHANVQPYLTMNYCIALQGVFPPRP